MKIDFLILAGGDTPEWIINNEGVKHKCLININNKPALVHIIDAIKNTNKEHNIVLVGSPALKEAGIDKLVNTFIEVDQENTLADNVRCGFKETSGDYVVLLSGDIPGVTSYTFKIIDEMINGASDYELIVPIITKSEIESKFPGSKRTYAKIKEGKVKIGNFLSIRKSSFIKLDPLINKYTEGRKSLLKLILSFGVWNLIKLLIMGSLSIPELEKILLKTTGINAKGIIVPLGEVGVDLDKESDLQDLRNYIK